jgi:hypothetical protein
VIYIFERKGCRKAQLVSEVTEGITRRFDIPSASEILSYLGRDIVSFRLPAAPDARRGFTVELLPRRA